MADTSLNENRIGLLIWQTSNLWQSKIRSQILEFDISFNEYLILETIYNLSKILSDISQIDIVRHSFIIKPKFFCPIRKSYLIFFKLDFYKIFNIFYFNGF